MAGKIILPKFDINKIKNYDRNPLPGTVSPTETLTINDNIGPTLVWFRYNNVNASVINPNSEVILTYRTNAGSYKPPTTGGPGTLNRNTTYTSGWVLNGVPQQSLTLYRPDQWNMNNAVSTQYEYDGVSSLEVPLGTIVTLRTWSSVS